MRRSRFWVAAVAIGIMVAAGSPANAEPGVLASGEGRTIEDVRVVMSDGVALVGDVQLPEGKGPFPVLLTLTPYGPATYQSHYLDEGYAHANFDVRGSGGSEGATCLFCDREQEDVYEMVEWVASQPWSDGNVGMYGGSYLGITTLLGAAKQPPHLEAIVPRVAYADPYRDIAWHNGLFPINFFIQWQALQPTLSMTGTSTSSDMMAKLEREFAMSARLRPWDSPWYWERAVNTKYDQIKVPTLQLGGWFDGFSRGTLHNFQGIAANKNHMIMGPGTHKGAGGPFDPASPYADAGLPPGMADDPILAWFDRFLKGKRNGIDRKPAAWYYDLGESESGWVSAKQWPPRDATLRRFYLSGEPSGSSVSPGDGSLVPEVPTSQQGRKENTFVYDPTVGVTETFSKWGTLAATPHLRLDQRADGSRGLIYTTDTMSEPLRLAGPIELNFWGSTSASDADWVVKVTDVAPDGSSTLLTTGYVRASHRQWDADRSRPAAPWLPNTDQAHVTSGKALEYRVDIWDIAHTLAEGHRLRINISGSDTPNHEPLAKPAVNMLMHGPDHPSQLIVTTRP